jgi:hypothetical protein
LRYERAGAQGLPGGRSRNVNVPTGTVERAKEASERELSADLLGLTILVGELVAECAKESEDVKVFLLGVMGDSCVSGN